MRLIDGDDLWERLDNEPWFDNADRDEIALPMMQKGDTIRARFMTLPDLFPGKGCEEKKFPIRKGTVVYVHPKGRYIVAECGGVRETFFPEDIIQCDLPGPPPMEYDLKEALVTLTEVDKKIMTALGRRC